MKKHIQLLGIFYIAYNILTVLAAIILFITLVGIGVLTGEEEAIGVLFIVAIFIGGFMFILSLPGILGGIGLLMYWPWARILVLILGFLNLLSFPLGTMLGIYTIWVLFQDETTQLFK